MDDARCYSEKDLVIVDDAIAFIRRRPDRFFHGEPTGAAVVSRLVRDLILLNAGSLRIVSSGSWYLVSATRDWLMSEDGSISFEPFRRLLPMPEGGMSYDRSEVMIAALADAVVTSGIDGTTWINGDPAHRELPNEFDFSQSAQGGRTIAFHFSGAAENSQQP